MAAVQVARHLGAEIYGTASESKQHVLEGLAGVASSRTLDFADAVPQGRRRAERPRGRVRGRLDGSAQRGRPVPGDGQDRHPHRRSGYRAFDLSEAGPDRIRRAARPTSLGLFEAGACSRRCPVRAWDVREAKDAFRFVSQAKHIGKVVLRVPEPIDKNGTDPHHRRHRRARHPAGPPPPRPGLHRPAPGQPDRPRHRRRASASRACDVTDRAQLEALVAEEDIRGVVHAAGRPRRRRDLPRSPRNGWRTSAGRSSTRPSTCTNCSATSPSSCSSPRPPPRSARRGRATTPPPTPPSTRSPELRRSQGWPRPRWPGGCGPAAWARRSTRRTCGGWRGPASRRCPRTRGWRCSTGPSPGRRPHLLPLKLDLVGRRVGPGAALLRPGPAFVQAGRAPPRGSPREGRPR